MNTLQAIKDTAAEQRIFTGRTLMTALLALLAAAAVIARLAQLQIVDHAYYAELAAGNQTRLEAAAPTRGLIVDRNGNVLAENLPVYQLVMIAEQTDNVSETLERLRDAGLLNEADLTRIATRQRSTAQFDPVTLRSRLSADDIEQFTRLRPWFPGIDIRARLVRHYPHGELAAHVLGYVGGLSSNDLQRIDRANYQGTDHIGKAGIERAFESILHGEVGHTAVVTTAEGRAVDFEPRDEPTPGRHLHLTLDINLQRVAEQALKGRRGAVVAMDPNNGDILAMASAPAYDPNQFVIGMNQAEFDVLNTNPDRPLFNRAITGQYPPGSTIKPLLAFGALDSGRTSVNRTIQCNGFFSLPGSTHRYRDWKPEGHGLVNLTESIAQSCDVYFYELAQDMDIDMMHDYLSEFGLGQQLGIGIAGEKSGLIPSRAWKKTRFSKRADQVWFPGETVIASIGQGYMLATPLQLAHITSAVATRGQRFRPRLMLGQQDPISGDVDLATPDSLEPVASGDQHAWSHTVDAMAAVMQSPTGSAFAAGRDAAFTLAGKSGTAQVFSVAQEDEYDELELDERLRDPALFVAFAPVEAPRIAVAVIIENGDSGSSVAAPVARAVLDAWLTR
ncbi:MAG: penicillin-binding protein 2 [Pseudomonadota bacterium]